MSYIIYTFYFGVKWFIFPFVWYVWSNRSLITDPHSPSHSQFALFPISFTICPFHQVTKRDEDSSLMQLKEEFRTYEALRREHDAQIVHIAMEAGLRISPEQWSSLLYGDLVHKSHMQSIIDKVPGWFICPKFLHSLFINRLFKCHTVSLTSLQRAESLTLLLSSSSVAVSRVVCKERSGADDRTAEDRRPRQPHKP